MKSFITTSISLLFAVSLSAQSEPPQPGVPAHQEKSADSTEQNAKPIDSSNFDSSMKPADDFFLYANGGWIKRTEIPPEYTRWGSFNELIERNNDALHAIAEKAQNTKIDPRMAPAVQKVGDFYASGMDEKTIEASGAKPLDEEFKAIEAVNDRKALLKEIAHLHSMGIPVLFNFGSAPDSKDSTHEIAQAVQGGLGLPDRDYYTKTDEASKKLREQYVDHIAKMLTLLGDPASKAQDEAKKILALETKLAQASRTRVQLRDPQKNYNKMQVRQLQDLTPDWNWGEYFNAISLLTPQDVNVHQPEFFKTADQVFKETPLDDFKTYLRWHLIDAAASDLSKDFVDEDFNFKERTLRGAQQIKPRWKRVVTSEDGAIGEALGKLYVAYNFPPEAKARALEMVNNLKAALAERIKTLDWMDQPTKEQALKKLAAMQVKIGYPDKWLDYSMLSIDRGPYVLNDIRASQFATTRDLNKIGKPVDPTEWGMTPPTVNAYYQPNRNEIVFPAGILQPPFFYANADDAVNYGAIGAVIGHEMTHGFDDQGRQFDANGNLRDWWSKKSADEYNKRRKEVVAQYNAYEALPGLHVNGELTQGENIADIGGVKLAYAALQKALAKHPEERTGKIDGFTPEQRFFLSFAAIWRSKIRDEDQKLRLNTDPHSPAHFRVNGPLSDLPEFQQAFNIPNNAPMVRPADKRVNIW
ncbi:MAG: M13 family metallopeptidase [Alphaproteobacteria bacterium]